ncbi:TPA: hypothetical protein JD203_18405 [Cronobacter sakazakii]|nr:hypothetical protein [Cronobacter sakazakii]EGT5650894.1 hypothetical protein [Cronobacter sakazakii]EGT5748519.1 hypothetical protein [Cronobacter sakazakii]EGT5752820.1 hypothetical protein [Cronobacter sakazakii]KAB0824822.1 hypothetical protein FZI24_05140 [Cronobacter sakazakii]
MVGAPDDCPSVVSWLYTLKMKEGLSCADVAVSGLFCKFKFTPVLCTSLLLNSRLTACCLTLSPQAEGEVIHP